MPQAQQDIQSPYTFVKGLITEANKLAEPDNSASDMLNIQVDIKGVAKVRYGLELESGHEYANSLITSLDTAVNALEWKNVNGDPATNFLVLQIGTSLFFYDMNSLSVSSSLIGTADFSTVCISTASAALSPVEAKESTVGLVCVNQYADPFVIMYDVTANEFVLSRLVLKIRDFAGMPDGLRIDENPTTLSNPHLYNLLNQGWANPGDSGLDDNSGSGTDGGGTSSGGGGSIDSGDNFDTLEP
jgi:uncharacterized membrane protein YgcG